MDYSPKCKTRNCKTLREKHRQKLDDIHHSKILYDPPPRVMEIKTKINKQDLIKHKSFHTAKETISKVKRQPSKWEKIIANETTDKGLISKMYKQLIQLNTRKTNNPIKSGQKIQSIHENILNITHYQRNANQNYNEILPHTSQNGHLQRSTNNKCWKGCGEKASLLHC